MLVILEGRGAARKDGIMTTDTVHTSRRDTRIVALGAPSDRERRSCYF